MNKNNSPKENDKKTRTKKRQSVDYLENSVTVTRPRHSRLDKHRMGRRSSGRRVHSKSLYSSHSRSRRLSHIHSSPSRHHRRSHENRPRSSRLGHSSHRHRSNHDLRTRTGDSRHRTREHKSFHSSDGLGQSFPSSHDSQHSRMPHHKPDDFTFPKVQSVKVDDSLKQNASSGKHPLKQLFSPQFNLKFPSVKSTPQRSIHASVQTYPPTMAITQDRLGISNLNAGSSSSNSEESSSEMDPLPPPLVKPLKKLPNVHGKASQYAQQPANQFETSPQTEHRDSDPENSSESGSQKVLVNGTSMSTLTQQNNLPVSGVQSTRAGQAKPPKWPM